MILFFQRLKIIVHHDLHTFHRGHDAGHHQHGPLKSLINPPGLPCGRNPKN